MPSALFFKLRIFSEDKQKIELSAFHLYNGNTRVDQDAVIYCGFENDQIKLDILKNDTVVEGVYLAVENTALVRKSQLYVVWTFPVQTNVNAFRVGTTNSPDTMVDKFSLSYSDNQTIYTNFINIGLDKRLSYPGPWQLSQLKPVGQSFPLVLKRGKEIQRNDFGGVCANEDGRGFTGTKNWPVNTNTNIVNGSDDSVGFSNEVPGIFESGKFYFENFIYNRNPADSADSSNKYNFMTLALVPDNSERILFPSTPDSPVFAITSNFSSYLNYGVVVAGKEINRGGTNYSAMVRFVPGYQQGFLIDFDTREIKYMNPSWGNEGLGPFVMATASAKMATFPVGTKYKLFFYFDSRNNGCFPGVDLNVGQDSFVNTVPIGFEAGLGPRWKEEVDGTISYIDYTFDNYNRELEPYSNDKGYIKPHIVEESSNIIVGGGQYYIKGFIRKVPDAGNKRFIAQLFSVVTRTNIAQCLVTSSGLYEFYGIAYGAYTVTSIDILNNTVSECIGPVYPLIIE